MSIHSPNFKRLIIGEDNGSRDFKIIDYDNTIDPVTDVFLPYNLNSNSIDEPTFMMNDSILFLTEDKIIKCFKLK